MTMTIRQLEEYSLNALPALQSLHFDGWELRFSGGYPRRANSVQVLYPSLLPLNEKIAFCEAQYGARGLRTVFKLTAAAPDGLDAALRARGYAEDAITTVQTVDLTHDTPQPDPAVQALVEETLTDSWAADFARLNEESPARAAVIRQILERLAVRSAFIRILRAGETVALGRAALDGGWVAPYEIVTDPRYRQQGYGAQLMLRIQQWGMQNGAHSSYLQVMANNTPALRLYARAGYREQYRYWYLQKG